MLLQKELSIESLYGRSNFVEKFPQITEADPETLLVDTVLCMTTTQWWQIHFQNSFVSGSIFWGVGVGRYLQKLHPRIHHWIMDICLFLVCNHVTRRPCWRPKQQIYYRRIYMKMEFSSQRREMLCSFLTTNMAAVKKITIFLFI